MKLQCALLRIDPTRLVSEVALNGGPAPFVLWEEHQDAFNVFSACRNQWRVSVGMGGAWFQGLDFGSVDVALNRLVAPERQKEVFFQLLVMEGEGVKVLNA